MTRTRRLLHGLGVGYASQLVLALVSLWVTRFLLHRLGQHDYGLWLVATQLLAYLMLTDLGIVALLPREVAYATGRASGGAGGASLADVVGQTVRIVFWQLPMVALVAAVFWILLPNEWIPLRGPLGIVIVSYLITFPLRVPPATLSGLQDLAFLGALNTGSILLGTATTVALVQAGWGLSALAVGWAVTQVVLGGGALVRLRARFPEAIPSGFPRLTREAVRERFSRGMWISVSQIAVVLLNATDTVIIGKVLGAAAVVPYACTAKLMQFMASQPQMLMQTALPGLAELRASESRARILQAATALMHAMLIASGAIVCGVVAVNYGFVRLWVGEAQWGGLALTLLIAWRTVMTHWNLATGSAIFAFGYERQLALVGIADGLLFITITTILVRTMGITGVPLAGIVTLLAVSLPFNLWALARETGTSVWKLGSSLWPWAWRFALGFALATAAAWVWRPTSPPSLIAAGVLAVGAYGLVMTRRLQEPPLNSYLHPRIAGLLHKLPRVLRGANA